MSNFPKTLSRGDTVDIKDYFDDFQPIAGWICDYIFINNSHKVVLKNNSDIISNINNNQYEIKLSSEKTMLFNASIYQLNIKFTNTIDNRVKTITLDKVSIKENIEYINRIEVESWSEKGLRIILSYLADENNPRVQSYEIDGRKITNFSHEELVKKKAFYENEIRKEQIKKNKYFKNNNIVQYVIKPRY